jgi:uncharacterized protein RhaS with RHS repeats
LVVQDGATVVGVYNYNGLGERVKKTAGGASTYYVYDFSGNVIAEVDGSGTVQKEYIYWGKLRLAMIDAASEAVYYFHNDRLGTPELMTDASKTAGGSGQGNYLKLREYVVERPS